MFRFVVSVWMVLVVACGANADAGVLTMRGLATGYLGDTDFEGAEIIFRGHYDTNDVVEHDYTSGAKEWKAPAWATVEVVGIGEAKVLTDTGVFSYSSHQHTAPPSSLAIMFDISPIFWMEGGFNPDDADYDLTFPVGPIRVGFEPPPVPHGHLPTSVGDLFITDHDIYWYSWTAQIEIFN